MPVRMFSAVLTRHDDGLYTVIVPGLELEWSSDDPAKAAAEAKAHIEALIKADGLGDERRFDSKSEVHQGDGIGFVIIV